MKFKLLLMAMAFATTSTGFGANQCYTIDAIKEQQAIKKAKVIAEEAENGYLVEDFKSSGMISNDGLRIIYTFLLVDKGTSQRVAGTTLLDKDDCSIKDGFMAAVH